MADPRFEVLARLETLKCVGYGDLFVTWWLGKGTADDVRAAYAAERKYRKANGDRRMVNLVIVEGAAVAKPSPEVNGVLRAHDEEAFDWFKAEALAILAQGFTAAMLRSLVAGSFLIRREEHPRKVVSSIDEACQFLAPHVTGPAGTPTDAQLVAMLRAVA
jgi:hypothetical protein